MLPEKVKIGCYTYTVAETDEPIIIGNRCDYAGKANYHNLTIDIKKDMAENAKEQTFWHEVVHCIANYMNLEFDEDNEEKIVDSLANGLLSVMRDNCFPLPGQSR